MVRGAAPVVKREHGCVFYDIRYTVFSYGIIPVHSFITVQCTVPGTVLIIDYMLLLLLLLNYFFFFLLLYPGTVHTLSVQYRVQQYQYYCIICAELCSLYVPGAGYSTTQCSGTVESADKL